MLVFKLNTELGLREDGTIVNRKGEAENSGNPFKWKAGSLSRLCWRLEVKGSLPQKYACADRDFHTHLRDKKDRESAKQLQFIQHSED
jgi:hypothetical protein